MKQIIGFFLLFAMLVGFSQLGAKDQKAKRTPQGKELSKKSVIKTEKAEVIELQPLLKGMTFVRIRCQFNGTPYYQGYRDPREAKKEEFNANKIEREFKERNIPLVKNNIQKLYGFLETELKDNGVRIVDIQRAESSDSTVIPTITLAVEIIRTTADIYSFSLDLTATKWMSYWAGEESVQASVIVWWQKKLEYTTAEELMATLEKAASTLLENFTTQLTYANAKTAEELKPAPDPTTKKKEPPKPSKSKKKKK